MNAREIVTSRNGVWHGSYGTCACPVCQPDGRKDQQGLSVSDKSGRLLMKCHKSNCGYVDILRGLGVEGNRPPQVSEDERIAREADAVKRALSGSMMAERILKASKRRFHQYAADKGFGNVTFPTISIAVLSRLMRIPKTLEHLPDNALLLCVPMRKRDGSLQSIEFISDDGTKCFLPGGKLKKTACWMGKEGPVIVCEGVGTGLSIWRSAATLRIPVTVAAAGSAVNMKSLSDQADFVMADNDESETGKKTALEIGKPWVMPPIVGMDFNDYELRLPLEAGLLLSRLVSDARSLEARQTK